MENKIYPFIDEKVSIDVPKLIDTRMLVEGNSGSGKSYAVRKILEESYGKTLSIVFDVEGEYHTLREKYDFLLIGGDHGDIKLNLRVSRQLPKTILDLNVPVILDLSDLKNQERIRFVKEFLEALMELPNSYRKPILVIIEEAHTLAGEQEKQDSTWAVIDLMTRGRKRGYCGVLCTQRISKLHKSAIAECNKLISDVKRQHKDCEPHMHKVGSFNLSCFEVACGQLGLKPKEVFTEP